MNQKEAKKREHQEDTRKRDANAKKAKKSDKKEKSTDEKRDENEQLLNSIQVPYEKKSNEGDGNGKRVVKTIKNKIRSKKPDEQQQENIEVVESKYCCTYTKKKNLTCVALSSSIASPSHARSS